MMKNIIDFLLKLGRLKTISRRGWVLRGVKNPESVADHSFRLAMMAWFLGGQKNLDVLRAIKIALVHDICEIYAGDATPYDNFLGLEAKKLEKIFKKWPRFSRTEKAERALEKHKREFDSLKKLITKVPSRIKGEIVALWLDYERGLSKEARFIRQLDKMENLFQAVEYKSRDRKFPLKPWYIEAREKIDDVFLVELMNLLASRKHFLRRLKV